MPSTRLLSMVVIPFASAMALSKEDWWHNIYPLHDCISHCHGQPSQVVKLKPSQPVALMMFKPHTKYPVSTNVLQCSKSWHACTYTCLVESYKNLVSSKDSEIAFKRHTCRYTQKIYSVDYVYVDVSKAFNKTCRTYWWCWHAHVAATVCNYKMWMSTHAWDCMCYICSLSSI